MNIGIVFYFLGWVLGIEGILMILPCVVALVYREPSGLFFLGVALFCGISGWLLAHRKLKSTVFYAKEGFVAVSLSWIVLSFFGALPFFLSGEIPLLEDALFEVISGFTTTGASVLPDVEALSRCMLMWRSFTHWIGGMGVLVFILAVLPLAGGYNIHIMRAESPGPSVGKLVPRVRTTAKILYLIYLFITVVQIILLLFTGMPLFDSMAMSFGTAGTGGFGIVNSSCGDYTSLQQWIFTIFMILFGVNFNVYYLFLIRKPKDALRCEEMRGYLGIILVSTLLITWNIRGMFPDILTALKHAAFQVGSIITTTGYSTTDFDLWPGFSRTILVCPRNVKVLKYEGKAIEHNVLRSINTYLVAYILIFAMSLLLISLDNFDLTTNFTAIAATLNNIGPGLSKVGPTCNFGIFSPISKYILMFDMLAGRLELFPMLLLFAPRTWMRE